MFSFRMTYAVLGFVEEKLGGKFVENRAVEFAKSYEESGETQKTERQSNEHSSKNKVLHMRQRN